MIRRNRRTLLLASSDPYYSNTALLLPFKGANGATQFLDQSSNPKTVTPAGGVQISMAQSKFGGSSAYFDGAGDYLGLGTGSDFDLSTGDFTVEGWFYTQGASYGTILGKRSSAGGNSYCLEVRTGVIYFYGWTASVTYYEAIYVSGLSLGSAWHHVAFVRSGDVHSVYIDGIYAGGSTTANRPRSLSIDAYIGYSGTSAAPYHYTGYIEDFRVTRGIARYSANFVPPSESFPRE